MPIRVPIKDLRDTASFAQLVKTSPEPIIVTNNGHDEFVCMRSEDYRRMHEAEVRANLLSRIAISERERALGLGVNAFDDIEAARQCHGL